MPTRSRSPAMLKEDESLVQLGGYVMLNVWKRLLEVVFFLAALVTIAE